MLGGRRPVLLGLAVVCLACGEILGADAYRVAEGTEPDGAPAAAALPLLPALPDEAFRDRCTECAADQCDAYRQACLESERCTALLRCHGACSDPNCLYRCRDTLPESATFEDYYGCVFGSFEDLSNRVPDPACPAECNVGANWECAGQYDWDAEEPEVRVDVQVHNVAAPTRGDGANLMRHIDIAACDELPSGGEHGSCDPWQAVDEAGVASLTLRRRRSAFETRGGLAGEDRNRIYGRPLPRPGRLDLRVTRSYFRDVTLPLLLPTVDVDPEKGTISFRAFDCVGVTAPVTVEISVEGPTGIYFPAYGESTTDPTPAPSGHFVNVPAGRDITVNARRPADGSEISRRTVIVKSGHTTAVMLLPRARTRF
jgi:hypothetical protein